MMEDRRIRLAVGMVAAILGIFLVAWLWPRDSNRKDPSPQDKLEELMDSYEYIYLADLKGEFPHELFRLRNLRLLIVNGAEFTSLPDSFSRLPRLRRVVIKDAPLDHIPKALLNDESALSYLEFYNCPIQKIDPRTNRLEALDLINGKLREIPLALFDSTSNLRYLNLEGNQIEEIPEEIKNKYDLYRVGFRRNPITEVPWADSMWWHPIYLDLAGTNLQRLPEDPGYAGRFLQHLDLRDTPLEEVPPAWRELESIKEIYE